MNIHTFGCSYTYGVRGVTMDATSWPEQLAEMLPDQQISDWSFPETSLLYSIYHLNRLKNSAQPHDVFVFQIAEPYRYTHWRDGLLTDPDLRTKITDNYEKYSPGLINKPLGRYVQGENTAKELNVNPDQRVYKSFYTYHNRELEMNTYHSLCEHVRTHTDLCFSWENIQSEMSTTQQQSYCADEQGHFNTEGSKWLAQWVREQL